MIAGNEIAVTVANGEAIGVSVAESAGDVLYVTDGATASVSVTSVGDRGPQGDVGPASTLSIGTVVAGTTAAATLTGVAPNQTLNLVLPLGNTGPAGPAGPTGPAGPANSLSIGTVVTGATAAATITGTAPSQTLNLTLKPGDTGPAGPPGSFANAQTVSAKTSDYTLVAGDAGSLVTLNSASLISVTVPTFLAASFPVGTHIDLIRLGAGDVRVMAASGVTISTPGGLFLRARHSAATLVNIATNVWVIAGDVA